MLKKNSQSVFVNYTRNWNQSFLYLKKLISEKVLGEFENGTVQYMKGIFNNCSHALYFLNDLFGKLIPHKLIDLSYKNKYKKNLDIDFTCKTKSNKIIYFLSNKNNTINYFQIILFFKNGYVEITNLGVEYKIFKFDEKKKVMKNIFTKAQIKTLF